MNLDSFKEAFSTDHASSRGLCDCGREYYNSTGAWDWHDGELKKLQADTRAEDLNCSIGFIEFTGRTFVVQCTCWHDRANLLMRFMDTPGHNIATYLRCEKIRKLEEARRMPEIELQDDLY